MSLIVQGLSSPEILKVVFACIETNSAYDKSGSCEDLEVKLPGGSRLTSSNSAVHYIYETSRRIASTDLLYSLLDFEFSRLRPLVFSFLSAKAKNPNIVISDDLLASLSDLEAKLSVKQNDINKNAVISCVFCCCLVGFYLDTELKKAVEEKFPLLSQWLSTVISKPAFEQAWKVITGNQGVKAFGSYYGDKSSSNAAVGELGSLSLSLDAGSSVSDEEVQLGKALWTSFSKVAKHRKVSYPVLPVVGEKNILITSALPYVNNVPHLGNIIGCVLSADVFARYCRLRQWNTLYICGTDEYGTATETKAAQEGLTPQEICNKYNKIHSDVYKWFNIGFDYFGRTTTEQQTVISQDIFWHLYRNDYLMEKKVEQLYCGRCERFLADRFVEGTCPLCCYHDARGDQCDKCGKLINAIELKDPRCKICSHSPVHKDSLHLFIDLEKLEPKLRIALSSLYQGEGWSANAKTITNTWLRDGLKPRCITRDLKWGTPVPLKGFTDKVFYVWFDAPIGYLSITANYTEKWEKWWKNPKDVTLYNFMAKDNVPFHSVVFPSCLLGTDDNYTLVNHLNATEYLNYEDGKFSKSRGVGVFGDHAAQTNIEPDIWRFYLLYMRPEGQDTFFSWNDFMVKNNSELLNNLGNFVNRSLKFVSKTYNGIMPKAHITSSEHQLIALVNREVKAFVDDMTKVKLRESLRRILNISRLGNQYLQESQPWKLVKGNDADKQRAATVSCVAANLSCLLSVLLFPYMPTTGASIQKQLNAPPEVNVIPDNAAFMLTISPGHKISEPVPLFRKLEESEIEGYRKRFGGQRDHVKS